MFHRCPFYARRRSLACVIGVHLPMPGALGVFNHASGNRSRWRRSQSEPRKRTQCRVPFGREIHVHIEKRMFWKVLSHVFVPSSGLDENNIKGAFSPVVPY